MPLDLPDGTSCFIDANIFYYHFVETPFLSEACSDLLHRIAQGKVAGHASSHVIAEAIHKIMLAEAASRFGLDRAGLVRWLQLHPHRIAELREFAESVAELCGMNIPLLPIDPALLLQSSEVMRECGLLTNDAIIIALMRRHGLTHLATNDDDFNHVPGLSVWMPRPKLS